MRKQLIMLLIPLAIIFTFGYPVMTDPDRKDTDDPGADSAAITATDTALINKASQNNLTKIGAERPAEERSANRFVKRFDNGENETSQAFTDGYLPELTTEIW